VKHIPAADCNEAHRSRPGVGVATTSRQNSSDGGRKISNDGGVGD
jgi:hypothetical protein